MCCTRLTGNAGPKKSPKILHLGTITQPCRLYLHNEGTYRQSEKDLLNSNVSPTCPHNMVNFGPLAAVICWQVWGTLASFNGFHILASLLQRRRSPEANKTLHNLWPSPGLLHYIYIFGGSCPLTEFCQLQNSVCVQVLRSPILAALWHSSSGRQPSCGMVQRMELRNFCRGRHLYSAGRPSRWALAHILVIVNSLSFV